NIFFFSSRRRHTRFSRDWSSDVCSSDLNQVTHDLQLWKISNQDDLLEGLLIVNRYQYPNLPEEEVYTKLAELRRSAWYYLMYEMSPIEKVKLLNNVLFREFGLSGNTSDYHAPQN